MFITAGCSIKYPELAEQALISDADRSAVTIYYADPGNFVLSVHSAKIIIDKIPCFYLKSGEQITFYLRAGEHEISVSDTGIYFDYISHLNLSMQTGQSYYFKVYPVFEGTTFIPYYFIPIPMPDIRFKLLEVTSEDAKTKITGQSINPKNRMLIE
jgi:hypothetical protein